MLSLRSTLHYCQLPPKNSAHYYLTRRPQPSVITVLFLFLRAFFLHLRFGVELELVFKRPGLAETDLDLSWVDGVAVAEEVDCEDNEVDEVKPDVNDRPHLNVEAEEDSPTPNCFSKNSTFLYQGKIKSPSVFSRLG